MKECMDQPPTKAEITEVPNPENGLKNEKQPEVTNEQISFNDYMFNCVKGMGREKYDRFRYLQKLRELSGWRLTEENQKELNSLTSVFENEYRLLLKTESNAVPQIEPFESNIKIYTEQDLKNWKMGAQKYLEFSDLIREPYLHSVFENIFSPYEINQLKALFLGEKPVIMKRVLVDSYTAPLIKVLSSFGITVGNEYVYRADAMIPVIEKNKDIFMEFGSTNPEAIISKLTQTTEEDGLIVRGLLLGFPLSSVIGFQKGKENIERKGVNIYGIQWIDSSDTIDSKIKQQRLKEAFERSGILNIN